MALATFQQTRQGSLHLIVDAQYLGLYEKRYGQNVVRHYNIAVLFYRLKKDTNELVRRERRMGIGYFGDPHHQEFSLFYTALMGTSLNQPTNGELVCFDSIAHSIERKIRKGELNAYILFGDGKFPTIDSISMLTGEPKIKRTPDMVWSPRFKTMIQQANR